MKIYQKVIGDLQVNSYFLTQDDKNAIVIDCGDNLSQLLNESNRLGLKINAVLLTHAHFDHSGSAKALQEMGVKIYISDIDAPKLCNDDNLSTHFGIKFNSLVPDHIFTNGQALEICGITLKVLLTPGHTNGSVCFVVDHYIFSGDTLFNCSVGRTDFPTGNLTELVNSINYLFENYKNHIVFPGHGEKTTIELEKKFNPIFYYAKH